MALDRNQVGIHPTAQIMIESDFSEKEKRIIKRWADLWYITSAGKRTINSSEYKFALAKPSSTIEEALSITRELVIVFSPYEVFEARTLEAYDYITVDLTEQRYEKLCYALISGDERIEEKLKLFLTNQEYQVIIPFTYSSFDDHRADPHYIRVCF